MAHGYPDDTESDEAREGTLAHSIATGLLAYKLHGHPCDVPQVLTQVDGVEVTHDMLDGARMFAEYVSSVANRAAIIERPVTVASVHEYCFGTPDVVWYDPATNTVHVFDFKYGWGVVDAEDNYQCLLYALGAVETWGYPMDASVKVHIIQPRAMHYNGPIRTWSPLHTLEQYCADFAAAADAALSGNALVRSGQHCRYCTARHVCGAALDAGLTIYESLSIALPVEATVDQIAGRWSALSNAEKRLKKLKEAYEVQLTSLLQSGQRSRTHRIVSVPGRAEWVDKGTALMVAEAAGYDLRKQDLITPTQAKDAGLPAAVIDTLSIRKPGLKVVPIDHTQAEEAFK